MGSEVLSYSAYVTVTCIYISEPLVIAASRNNGVAALID